MEWTLETRGPDETRAIGVAIGRSLDRPALVFLDGEMGAGKTLLTKGLYEGIGGRDPDIVTSPTYTMVNVYEDAGAPIWHVDLYRIEKVEQILAMEYEDFLLLNAGVTIVEWPDFARGLVPTARVLEISFRTGADRQVRSLTISAAAGRYERVFAELAKT